MTDLERVINLNVKTAINILNDILEDLDFDLVITGDRINYAYEALDYLEEHCEIMNNMMKLKYGDTDE